jgi:hypothetical protein
LIERDNRERKESEKEGGEYKRKVVRVTGAGQERGRRAPSIPNRLATRKAGDDPCSTGLLL